MKSARAMTLLEVVLAVTLLAAMSTLIAALWSQASRWTGDSAGHHRAMRLPRVVEMMRTQWADRRTSARLDGKGATVRSDALSLTFITATAILEPGWPLVRAQYLVERDIQSSRNGQPAWRLVYLEMPLVDLSNPQGTPGVRPEGGDARAARSIDSPPVRRFVLLSGCSDLRWERFGRHQRLEAPPQADQPAPRADGTEADPPRVDTTEQEKAVMWREFEREYGGQLSAVRLTGVFEEQPFVCVFNIGDSR